jgi:hypothetical protein
MATASENRAIALRWLKTFWDKEGDPDAIDELSSPDVLLQCAMMT